jgi:hypothetical protein
MDAHDSQVYGLVHTAMAFRASVSQRPRRDKSHTRHGLAGQQAMLEDVPARRCQTMYFAIK